MRTRGARGLLLAGAIADYSFNFVFVYIIDHKAVGIHAAHILGPDVVRQPGGIGLKMLRSRWIDGPGPVPQRPGQANGFFSALPSPPDDGAFPRSCPRVFYSLDDHLDFSPLFERRSCYWGNVTDWMYLAILALVASRLSGSFMEHSVLNSVLTSNQ